MKYIIILIFPIIFLAQISAQDEQVENIQKIYNEALSNHEAYENLRYLCKKTKGRIAGTPEAAAAVTFTRQVLSRLDIDSVYLQDIVVPHWERGEVEIAKVSSTLFGSKEIPASALGLSVATSEDGLTGKVIEVQSLDELKNLGTEKISGKIVFFNRAMDPTLIRTFSAYGGAVDQRTRGASEASKFGAIGVVVRSLTTSYDDHPHTGVMYYEEGVKEIPAVMISTNGANFLSKWLENDADLNFFFKTSCANLPDEPSHNVIGEIKGSTYPDEIITIGGHLDAWDTGEGAHDDGAGCIQSIEVLRLFKVLGIQPKRTIRAVMFMDEEISQAGGKRYAELAKENGEKHYAALESDRGALTPRGFGFGTEGKRLEKLLDLEKYFTAYELDKFVKGGGGADIGPLREFGALLISYIPDAQRYFDFHHSTNDVFENVNEREMQLGSAAIASLIYLIDLYDL